MSEFTTESPRSRIFDVAKDFENIEALRAEIGIIRQQLEPLLSRLSEVEKVWKVIGGIPVARFVFDQYDTRYWVVGAGKYDATARIGYYNQALLLGDGPLKKEL